jgi:hypothetical protein
MLSIELVASILAAVLGAAVPALKTLIEGFLEKSVGEKFLSGHPAGLAVLKAFGLKTAARGDPAALFKELSAASERMDAAVKQIQDFTRAREQAVSKLESELGLLTQQEQDLKQRIAGLQNVPLPAAEYFAQMVEKREKKSAFRDYILFLLGVVVSAAVAVFLRKMGWA